MTDTERNRLPPALLVSLYKGSLVSAGSPDTGQRPLEPSAHGDPDGMTPTLGGFGSSVLILVSQAEAAVVPDAELAFLTNILKACRLGLDDVLIANIHGLDAAGRRSLVDGRRPTHLILFGMQPSDIPLPMSFPALKAQRHGQAHYLHAPSLQALQTDDAGKRALWVALKQMFGIA